MSSLDIEKELVPLVVEELGKCGLLVFVDARVSQGVQAKLFEVAQIKSPSQISHDIVKCYTFGVPETLIIRAQRNLNALCEKSTHRVTPQVSAVSKNAVGYGAALQAHVFLLD